MVAERGLAINRLNRGWAAHVSSRLTGPDGAIPRGFGGLDVLPRSNPPPTGIFPGQTDQQRQARKYPKLLDRHHTTSKPASTSTSTSSKVRSAQSV